jgi:hypothetical protein
MVVVFDKGLETVLFEIRRCLERCVDAPPAHQSLIRSLAVAPADERGSPLTRQPRLGWPKLPGRFHLEVRDGIERFCRVVFEGNPSRFHTTHSLATLDALPTMHPLLFTKDNTGGSCIT